MLYKRSKHPTITEISDSVWLKEPITRFYYKDFESDATALSFTEEDFIRHAHCLAWSTLPFILRLSFKPSKPLQRTALPFKVIWNHKVHTVHWGIFTIVESLEPFTQILHKVIFTRSQNTRNAGNKTIIYKSCTAVSISYGTKIEIWTGFGPIMSIFSFL